MRKSVNKDEVAAAIKEWTNKLGHVPSAAELRKMARIGSYAVRKTFGTYTRALKTLKLERQGAGYEVALKTLFGEWAALVRKLGRIPTMVDYQMASKHSVRPLIRHSGNWSRVPLRMLEYAKEGRLEGEWEDVLDVIANHHQLKRGQRQPSSTPSGMPPKARIMVGQPMYGEPLLYSPMTCAPINEMGVVLLFGALARLMGFAVTRIQPAFPDCEALRRVDRDRWQRVRIEFEYESRNFLMHVHPEQDCDLIVCWSHNWAECPLEVIELKTVMQSQRARDFLASFPEWEMQLQ